MIVKYTNFSDGIHEFQFSIAARDLEMDHCFEGDIDIQCWMDKSPRQVVIDCKLAVSANLSCDRCAKEFSRRLTNDFQITYLFSHDLRESDDYNLKYISPETDKIDLGEEIFEYTKLALPFKILCDDGCKGLCPRCGINLNCEQCDCVTEFPRDVWEPLNKLKDKFNN